MTLFFPEFRESRVDTHFMGNGRQSIPTTRLTKDASALLRRGRAVCLLVSHPLRNRDWTTTRQCPPTN